MIDIVAAISDQPCFRGQATLKALTWPRKFGPLPTVKRRCTGRHKPSQPRCRLPFKPPSILPMARPSFAIDFVGTIAMGLDTACLDRDELGSAPPQPASRRPVLRTPAARGEPPVQAEARHPLDHRGPVCHNQRGVAEVIRLIGVRIGLRTRPVLRVIGVQK
jgi:hypothetical protein